MKVANTNNSLKLSVLVLSISSSMIACSPAGISFEAVNPSSLNSLAAGNAAVSEGSNSGSAAIPTQGTGSGVVRTPVPVNDTAAGLVRAIDTGGFSVNFSVPECVDASDADMTFSLVQETKGKRIPTAIIDSIPAKGLMERDGTAYSVYAVVKDYEGKLVGRHIYANMSIGNEYAYDHFNCLLQISPLQEAADRANISYSLIPKNSEIGFKAEGEDILGFALVNQHTDAVTMRCYK